MIEIDRGRDESVLIGDDVRVTFLGYNDRGDVKMGIAAPDSVLILREEVTPEFRNRVFEVADILHGEHPQAALSNCNRAARRAARRGNIDLDDARSILEKDARDEAFEKEVFRIGAQLFQERKDVDLKQCYEAARRGLSGEHINMEKARMQLELILNPQVTALPPETTVESPAA